MGKNSFDRLKMQANSCFKRFSHVCLIYSVLIFVLHPISGNAASEKTALVKLPSREYVDTLEQMGLSVGSVKGNLATVYCSPESLEKLQELGLPFEILPEQRIYTYYPTYTQISKQLKDWANSYNDIMQLQSLGKSAQGRDIWAVLITDHPEIDEEEPEFSYISTIHGNELPGTILCMNFIEELLTQYSQDTRLTRLVDETAIWVIPLMNPDGYEMRTRNNANGIDLNRNFPKYPEDFQGTIFDGEPLEDTYRQPETKAIMRWAAQHAIVLSANFHAGALVANYPYDDDGKPSGVYSPTPDDALFQWLALSYASHNPDMFASPYFPMGITNGAAWYVIRGGMQDWKYRYLGCCHITLEISENYQPPTSALSNLWELNHESMFAYLEAVHTGVRGKVIDSKSGSPVYAKILVEGNSQPVFTDPDVGDYYRLLLPGTYTLSFYARGYNTQTVSDVQVSSDSVIRVDVSLEPQNNSQEDNDPQECPLEELLKNDPEILRGLRLLRDRALAKIPLGKNLIDTYYTHQEALQQLIYKNAIRKKIIVHLAHAVGYISARLWG